MKSDKNQIKYRQWINAKPEVVYDLLATSDGLDKWFCTGAKVDLENMRIQYRWVNWGPDKVSIQTDGKILKAERPFQFIWQWGEEPSTIEFYFISFAGGTRIDVLEYGYDENNIERKSMMMECASGWGEAMALIKNYLENGISMKNAWPQN